MPEIFKLKGYHIFFYSNENTEPCHVHVSKDNKGTSKIWIEPAVKVAHNKARISKRDLNDIVEWLEIHRAEILQKWNQFFFN